MSNTPSSMVSTYDLPAEAWRAFAVGLLRRAEKTEPGFASVLAEEFRRVAMKWDFFEHMLPTVEGDRVSTEVLRDHTGKALAVRKIAKDRHGEIRDIVEFETDSEGRPVWLMP